MICLNSAGRLGRAEVHTFVRAFLLRTMGSFLHFGGRGPGLSAASAERPAAGRDGSNSPEQCLGTTGERTLDRPCSPLEATSAICVQRVDDSICNSHYVSRSWLRSSSMREPRDPPCGAQFSVESIRVDAVFSVSTRELPFAFTIDDDPSAGSPTETLLRLLLPLNDQVRPT